MSCVSLLRRIGLLPQVTESEFSAAVAENALVDNTNAFTEMRKELTKFPESNQKLLDSIRKSTSPFADLELLMQERDSRQRLRRNY